MTTKKAILCVPTYPFRPHQAMLDAVRDAVPLLEAAGWEHGIVHEIGCPYISEARAKMLRKALDAKATVVVFIDQDVSFRPQDLLKLIETEGGLVAGTYRFKNEKEEYMGTFYSGVEGRPVVRSDRTIKAQFAPAGFMKIERWAVNLLIERFPELCYGERCSPTFDLFNHGAYQWNWYGEDFACCRRWEETGQELPVIPDLDLTHWEGDLSFPGNLHKFLLRQPQGSDSENPRPPG